MCKMLCFQSGSMTGDAIHALYLYVDCMHEEKHELLFERLDCLSLGKNLTPILTILLLNQFMNQFLMLFENKASF